MESLDIFFSEYACYTKPEDQKDETPSRISFLIKDDLSYETH